jgi:ComF family protein
MNASPTRFPPRARVAARAVLDVVFPRWCVGCAGAVPTGPLQHMCEACQAKIVFSRAPHCSTCGSLFPGEVVGARRCPSCLDLDPAFSEGRTGMLLKDAARAFVHELKYHAGWHLRGDLRGLAQRMEPLKNFVRGAVLVPVPLHPRRRRWRGFNQARWVAEALAAEGGATGIAELLDRVRDTPTQTRLDRAAREINMKNAFALHPGAVVKSAQRYILVDDVFTTGATLNACAKVLRQAGAVHLDIASLGHG